jgi:hypothetical protein
MRIERKEPTLGVIDAYEPPTANLEFASRTAQDAASIRMAHIRHERQLQSVGLLFGLGAVLVALMIIAIIVSGFLQGVGEVKDPTMMMVNAVIIIVVGTLLAVLAYGYRTLSPWVKYVGTPVSVLGLLAIPVGTLIHAYILYLIWCDKGRRVLADDYADIIRATPQVRYKRTVGDWIALGLLVGLMLALLGFILFATVFAS